MCLITQKYSNVLEMFKTVSHIWDSPTSWAKWLRYEMIKCLYKNEIHVVIKVTLDGDF